jgi:C-terminal peptidase prc
MKYLLITLSLISLNLIAEKKKMDEYWRETGITFAKVEEIVDKTSCEKNETEFLACMLGLSTVYALEKPTGLKLVPKAVAEANPSLGKVVETIDDLAVIEPVKLKTNDILELIKKQKAERTLVINGWKDLYKNISKSKVDYEVLIKKVKDLKNFKDNEANATGSAMNTILEVQKDPHTRWIPKQYWDDSNKVDANSFFGIGCQIRKVLEKFILAPMPGSPALKAGLKNGDILTLIEGQTVEKLDTEQISGKIKGPQGTTVTVTIERPSEKNKKYDLKIVRDLIKNEPVTWDSKKIGNVSVGYTKLDSFVINDNKNKPVVCEKYKEALSKVSSNDAIILDVRQNPGGYLTEAVCLANLFLDKGELVLTAKSIDGKTTLQEFRAKDKIYTEKPFIVLQNAGSASASELVAGAFQDHERAFVVGDRSYGKGTIQQIGPMLSSPKLMLAKTSGRFHLPTGRTNQIVGVIPDVLVYEKPNPTELDKFSPREEDYYAAVPALGTPWVQTRPTTISKLDTCLKETGSAEKDFAAKQNDALAPDYQLLKALDTARCVVEKHLAVEKANVRDVAQSFQADSFENKVEPVFIEQQQLM